MRPAIVKSLVVAVAVTGLSSSLARADDPLPSWTDGPAKQAILEFVKATTSQGSPEFVPRGGAYCHVRSGRHALGRASDVHRGDGPP